MTQGQRQITVLASPGSSDPEGNPYIHLLYSHMPDGIRVLDFTRRRLLDRPDVVHVHWPEFLVRFRAGRVTASLDVIKVLSLLWIARRRGAALVWTGHDPGPMRWSAPGCKRSSSSGSSAWSTT